MTRAAGISKPKGSRRETKKKLKFQNNVSLISDKLFWFFLPQKFLPRFALRWWKSKLLFLLKEFFSDYVLGKRKPKKKDGERKKGKSLQISLLISWNFIFSNCFTTSFREILFETFLSPPSTRWSWNLLCNSITRLIERCIQTTRDYLMTSYLSFRLPPSLPSPLIS